MGFLRKAYWSPYVSGIIIGLLQIPIFLSLHASIGSSGSFHTVACSILPVFSGEDAVTHCFPALKSWWQVGFVLGILIGAYISSKLSHMRRRNMSAIWSQVTGISSFKKRALMAFMGGFIMVMGARIADGCTSGNGISGIALQSLGSMIVILSMFTAGAICVQFYRNKSEAK